MTGNVLPFQGLSPRDGPGLVRALARLIDNQHLRLAPEACDTATVQHVKDALQAVLDDRVLLALQGLLDTLRVRQGGGNLG